MSGSLRSAGSRRRFWPTTIFARCASRSRGVLHLPAPCNLRRGDHRRQCAFHLPVSGAEILNVSVYVLIAWRRESIGSIEAAIKYLIPGAVGGAFLLFGMALVYANLGTMGLSSIISLLARPGSGSLMVSTGLLLIAVGIGFKLALAPFHLWTPDVYEGAPVPATAIVATVSKAAVFALFMRYFYPLLMLHAVASAAIATMAVASMIVGNLLAVRQPNLKRIIAYSSIAHMGYFLSAFIAGGRFGIIAATYYLTAYLVTLIVAFGVLSMLSRSGNAETIADIRSLSARSPWLAGAFAVACASFAGLPLAAGFLGSFMPFPRWPTPGRGCWP